MQRIWRIPGVSRIAESTRCLFSMPCGGSNPTLTAMQRAVVFNNLPAISDGIVHFRQTRPRNRTLTTRQSRQDSTARYRLLLG
jgi:hypothetical protein